MNFSDAYSKLVFDRGFIHSVNGETYFFSKGVIKIPGTKIDIPMSDKTLFFSKFASYILKHTQVLSKPGVFISATFDGGKAAHMYIIKYK